MKHLWSGFLLFLPILAFDGIKTSVSGEVAYKLEQGTSEARSNNKKLTSPTSYAHSPIDLFHLAALEEHFYHIVKKYAKKLPDAKKPRFIKRYIADYEESSLKAYTSIKTEKERNSGRTKIYSHPFLKHRMIWRFAKYFHKIHAVINASKNLELKLKAKIKKVFHEGFQCPNKTDLKHSKQSLTAIHDVYDIKIKEFASGNFSSLLTNITLSALHCHEMAIFAFKEKKYIFAIDWIVTADAMSQDPDRHPILDKINEKALLKLLNAVIAEHDSKWIPTPSPKTNEELYFYQNKIDTDIVLVTQKSVYQKNFVKKGFGQENNFFSEAAFSNLCQGKNLQTVKEKSELYCWYERMTHPYWFINPQRMELLSQEPYIIQVYNFVGDKLMSYLKDTAASNLVPAAVSQLHSLGPELEKEEGEEMKYNSGRTSKYHWIYESDVNPIHKLNKRIGFLTSLVATTSNLHSTSVQIANYATGGLFDFHVDPLKGTLGEENYILKIMGNRLATFMIYLNDVDRGGNTVFTSAGVSVAPLKGSAVFWYNTKRNGEIDFRTWHGGCPVVLGTKWVANKWIHMNLNMFTKKCSLNKNE